MADATIDVTAKEANASRPKLAAADTAAQFDFAQALQKASQETGRSPFALSLDYAKASLGKAKLSHDEFFRYRIYDKAALSSEDRAAFVGQTMSNIVNLGINKAMESYNIVDEKLMYGAALRGLGLRTPVLQAMLQATDRELAYRTLKDAGEFAGYLRTDARYPLFCKPYRGSLSRGAASFERYDEASDRLIDVAGNEVDPDAFAAEAFREFGDRGYMVQDRVIPHPELQEVSGYTVGTVRMFTLDDGNGPQPLYAVWKIPAFNTVADNLWRKGNLIGDIDMATGEVRAVRRSGIDGQTLVHSHPDSGAQLIGRVLPDWEEAKSTVRRAASLTPHILGIGFDLALSDQGPLVIEGNTRPNHGLYQAATGQGLLSSDRRAAFDRATAHALEILESQKARRKASSREFTGKRKAALKASIAKGHETAQNGSAGQ